jgi:mannitol-1-phosphate 5-dehydrogenase
LKLRSNFQHELIRKVYTYNCSNAAISYLGYLKGYKMLFEAANDAEILAVTRGVYAEAKAGLVREYGFNDREQEDLQNLALTKYQDRKLVDPIERNGRDTQRKLSATDRLVGPANLAVKHGVEPVNLALAIAAGFHYNGSTDDGTRRVQQILRERGLKAAVRDICGLADDSVLGRLIVQRARDLTPFNRIGAKLVFE